METAYFTLLKDTDILLMQAIFKVELHKLVQTNSESGTELCGLKIKTGYITRGCNYRLLQGGTNFNHSV